MISVAALTPKRGRNVELLLLILAVGVVMLAYANVEIAANEAIPPNLLAQGAGLLGIAAAFHLVLRWRASYADPLLLPIVTLLNGLGLVMLHRIDIARGTEFGNGLALRQLTWSALAVAIAIGVLMVLRDHRLLRKYTYIAGLTALILLLMPLLPFIGQEQYGARIWIRIGSWNFQPGEVAKIALAVFFAGYLVTARDALSVAGKKFVGMTLPRGKDLGPILVAWVGSLGILVFQRDLGASLLIFGLFVAMLYVATERISWIAIGMSLLAAGTYFAYGFFSHFQTRIHLWLDPFAPGQSDQVAKGLMGLAAGGLVGTGLGRGRPTETYVVESDFIFTAFGEEIGLIGLFAMILLYALLVERGLRAAIGVRDGFGKLLAAGLAFSIALQCFVVIGGLTRVIPLTGLTTPFLSAGGSSLLANWTIVALLLRISDQARRPVEEPTTKPVAEPTEMVRAS